MKNWLRFLIIYVLVLSAIVAIAAYGSEFATKLAAQAPVVHRKCVIIDAGHGGVDGGATSCTGLLESGINLEFAVRLNDLFHLLGISTKMIRTDDRSVYTEGETIAAKKVSDLRERVRIVNSTTNGILISIHQNYFSDSQYYGAQVFYGATESSKDLAHNIQNALNSHLNNASNRSIKNGNGIFLLEKADCTAILIECGFLSNPAEEAKLRSCDYQQKMCCIIAANLSSFLAET